VIFTTWLYGLFFVVTATVYWLLPHRFRVEWLIGAGIVFYTNYYPPHVWLILVLTVLVYAIARAAAAAPDRRRWLLTLGIAGSLSVLGYYKYSGMLLQTARSTGATLPLDALVPSRAPLAISFFVFEYVHYLIEIRRGRIGPGSPREFFLFILFFPTLICGPIKRFYDFAPQVAKLARFDTAEVSACPRTYPPTMVCMSSRMRAVVRAASAADMGYLPGERLARLVYRHFRGATIRR